MRLLPCTTLCCFWLLLWTSRVDALAAAPPHSLYQDMAAAQERRAAVEQELLRRGGGDRELPYGSSSSGGGGASHIKNNNSQSGSNKKKKNTKPGGSGQGFGTAAAADAAQTSFRAATRAQSRTAANMAAVLERDGAIRLPAVLSAGTAEAARRHVLALQLDVLDLSETATDFDATLYYGVEPGRTCRTDLLLPFDGTVQAVLAEVLRHDGVVRHLFCELLGPTAPLYEAAAVITAPGSVRQTVHPDLPWVPHAPLYVAFVALQDVVPAMGPTTFLLGTHRDPPPVDAAGMDDVLAAANAVASTMKVGDAVIFDARVLHCGNANTAPVASDSSSSAHQDPTSSSNSIRALFNFSFRRDNGVSLGYQGSIRPGYEGRTSLGELLEVADQRNGWGDSDKTLESVYGNGLPQR